MGNGMDNAAYNYSGVDMNLRNESYMNALNAYNQVQDDTIQLPNAHCNLENKKSRKRKIKKAV